MDAHYHQVMKAREAQKEGPARAYFGYSTILDRQAFEEWNQQHSYDFFKLPEGDVAEARDTELIFDFPSRWWGGRVAGLGQAPGKSIFGKVFMISPKDWPVIQHKEGHVTGMCVEREIPVMVQGKQILATAFTTAPGRQSQTGPVSPRFMEALIRGAQASKLPDTYIEQLKEIARSIS